MRERVLTDDAELHHCGDVNESLQEHLLRISGAQSTRALALDTGIEPSTLNRQLAGEVKVQTIVTICRRYGAPLLPSFVIAGFITEAEARSMSATASLSDASDVQLAEEILDRVRAHAKASPALTEPLRTKRSNVTQLRPRKSEDPSTVSDPRQTPSVDEVLERSAARRVEAEDLHDDDHAGEQGVTDHGGQGKDETDRPGEGS